MRNFIHLDGEAPQKVENFKRQQKHSANPREKRKEKGPQW